MADYHCPYGYGWCEVPYKDCPHWQGTFCELDVEAEKMDKLKPCPFCGGEVEERGGQCNYGKKIMTLDLMCRKCGTLFKFKSKWIEMPYIEAVEAWNRRAGEEEKHETD